jgi:hypothetical protein
VRDAVGESGARARILPSLAEVEDWRAGIVRKDPRDRFTGHLRDESHAFKLGFEQRS